MRQLVLLGFFFLLLGNSSLFAQKNFRVQLTVFDQNVPTTYFHGLDDVWVAKDHNDLYRYHYGGDYESEAEAKAAARKAIEAGYPYAKVVDLEEMKVACVCDDPASLTSIFFNFDKYYLRPDAIDELNTLISVLRKNPAYQAVLEGHTDAKGTNEYNVGLSKARAFKAKDYLMSNGIGGHRLQVDFFGEERPVAKNALANGQDSPQGRQFNRRVTIEILGANGKPIPGLVRGINVPNDLLVIN